MAVQPVLVDGTPWASTATAPRSTEEVQDRVMDTLVASLELAGMAMGERLGWYRALSEFPDGATPSDLAAATDSDERVCREWLEQQSTAGMLDVTTGSIGAQRFCLPQPLRAVLVDTDSLAYMAPLVRMVAKAVGNLPGIVRAARDGGGLSWVEQGADMREGQGDANRVDFLTSMCDWVAMLPDVETRLTAPGARIADIGCGVGWSSIALASAFPQAVVDAFDVDEASVEAALRNVAAEGLDGRVRVHLLDVAAPGALEDVPDGAAAAFHLVTAFECVHDMPDPVGVLRGVRSMVQGDGAVLVADEKVAERLTTPGDQIERLMYGYSLTICLPDSMSTSGSAATGTVMRPGVLSAYAEQAGFRRVDVLDVDHDFWRFYRLVP